MMGKAPVVEFLLKNCDNIEEMIGITDGRKMTGFMTACQQGRSEVVNLILKYQVCLQNNDIYEGFKLACEHKWENIIILILEIDQFRSHILEKEQANVTRSPGGKVVIQQKSKSSQGYVY